MSAILCMSENRGGVIMSGYCGRSAEGYSNYLVWLAGEVGDTEHPEPDFDENGCPVFDDEND